LYAIRDGTLSKPIPDGDRHCRSVHVAAGPSRWPACGRRRPDCGGAPNGWYHDLPDGTGARRRADRRRRRGDVSVVNYIGTQVTNDPCTIALPANIYARHSPPRNR
jgi:hypothetical protein